MSVFDLLRTRRWIYIRRLILVAIILFLGLRNYGGSLSSWFNAPDQQGDILITKAEFRPDIGETKPAWVIGLLNRSSEYTYDQIELEATYLDQSGKVLETDKMMVRQKLIPGAEQLIASSDIRNRPGAVAGTLRVLDAVRVQP